MRNKAAKPARDPQALANSLATMLHACRCWTQDP